MDIVAYLRPVNFADTKLYDWPAVRNKYHIPLIVNSLDQTRKKQIHFYIYIYIYIYSSIDQPLQA
jgi:hypothetical protein